METIPNSANEFLAVLDQAKAGPTVLTWAHPRFPEFAERFDDVIDATGRGWEESDDDHRVTGRILREMGGLDVERSLAWIMRHGGYDDVEVGLNVIGPWEAGPDAMQAAEHAPQ